MAEELVDLLDIAIEALAGADHAGWSSYDRPEDFAAELRALRSGVAQGDRDAFSRLRSLFAPTGEWDECVGPGGAAGKLADDISNLLQARLDAQSI